MASTMQNLGKLQRRTCSVRKSNDKPRISVIPLTREKVKVAQRNFRKRESRGTADWSFRTATNSPEASKTTRSKQLT